MVGDRFLGDIAIDEVKLLTTSCTTFPSYAKPGVSTSLSGKGLIIEKYIIQPQLFIYIVLIGESTFLTFLKRKANARSFGR